MLYRALVLMMHMVQGRQYSVCTVYKHAIYKLAPQSQIWSLRPTLDLDSDRFDASITGDDLDGKVQLPNFRSLMVWHAACMMLCTYMYSARLVLFIHGITSAKRTHEVRPVALVRGGARLEPVDPDVTSTCHVLD